MATAKKTTKNSKLNKNQISIEEVVANKKPTKKLTEAEKAEQVNSIKQAIKQGNEKTIKAAPAKRATVEKPMDTKKVEAKATKKPIEDVKEINYAKKPEPSKVSAVSNSVQPEKLDIKESVKPTDAKTDKHSGKKKKYKKSRILTAEEVNPKLKKKKAKPKKRKKNFSLEDVERYNPDKIMGLTEEQVHKRVEDRLTNKVDKKVGKSYGAIFFTNIFTFFNLVCMSVAGALIAVGAWKNCMFMVIILANMFIGIFQEIKAKRTVEKISLVTEPTATVIRDGLQQNVPIAEVVLDDIILFNTGKQICADCIMVDGEVEANESMLTGESVPVKKRKGDVL